MRHTVMNARILPRFFSLALLLAAPSAPAQEQVLDPAAVRHRLFSPGEHLEASLTVGLPAREYLTAHYNLNVGLAYNLFNTLGMEARAGYALSRHTGLARSISESFLAREDKKITDELEDMWEMNLHGVVGARWAPIYGKLSLLADETAHFQAYLWAGGGLASLRRQSVIQCTRVVNRDLGVCDNRTDLNDSASATESFWRTETRMAPVVSGAAGFRFFLANGHALRFELRDWVFADQYRVNVVREDWEAGRESGEPARNPGLTHLVQFDLGYTFIF
jgi:outer membrane beta-barrel protein